MKDENVNDFHDKNDLPEQEDILFFNGIVHYVSQNPSLHNGDHCNYHKTIAHEATLCNHLNYNGSSFNVCVLWENGEEND